MSVLLRGTGGEEHERELYKLLAATGIKTEDLNNPEIMGMIQEILTEQIVDEEMNEDDVEFAARALAFRATEGQRGSKQRGTNNR